MTRLTLAMAILVVTSACTHDASILNEQASSKAVIYELIRNPVSGVEMPRIRLPERPAIERDVNTSLDAAGADLMCMPSDQEQDESSFESSIEVTYAADDVLSIAIGASYYCGGARPTNGADLSMTFDLVTGKQVSFRRLFQDYERDAERVSSVYLSTLSAEDLEDCDDVLNADTIEMYRFNYTLSPLGVTVRPQFPTMFVACAHPKVLAFDRLSGLADPAGILARIATGDP